MKMYKQKTQFISRQKGFTLIEIMVVVIIIGLLSTLVAPKIFANRDKAFVVKAKADVSRIGSALDLYRLDNFSYPNTSEGLQALVTNPGKPNWTGYLEKLPNDPWDNKYQYQQPGTQNSDGYDLWSFGADGAPGGEGNNADVGNWEAAN